MVNRAQHIPHPGFLDRAPTKRDGLVEDTQGVAQTALRCPCEQLQRYCIAAYLFLFKHMLEMRGNQRRWNLLQVELQATRQNRDRNSLRICGRKDELDVLRRLLQRFQHRIESRFGEHVYFVDDVNLVTGSRGCVKRILEQFPHLFHLRIGGRIHLKQINEAPRINFSAGRTYPAGRRGNACPAIESLG